MSIRSIRTCFVLSFDYKNKNIFVTSHTTLRGNANSLFCKKAESRLLPLLLASSRSDFEHLPFNDTDDTWYGELAPVVLGPATLNSALVSKPVSRTRNTSGPVRKIVPQNAIQPRTSTETLIAALSDNSRPKVMKRRNRLQLLRARDLAFRILEQREVGVEDFIENLFERSVSIKMAADERGLCQELVSSPVFTLS